LKSGLNHARWFFSRQRDEGPWGDL